MHATTRLFTASALGASLMLGGCATRDAVEHAQSTADAAQSSASAAQSAAQTP